MSILTSIVRSIMAKKIKKDLKAHDEFIQTKIENITGEKILWNNKSNFFVEYFELNDFKSLNCKVTGFLEINTISHVRLEIFEEKDSFTVKSESEIIESMCSEVTKVGITKFDIEIDTNFMEYLQNNEIVSVKMSWKNGQLLKYDDEILYDNIDQKALLEVLTNA